MGVYFDGWLLLALFSGEAPRALPGQGITFLGRELITVNDGAEALGM